MLPTEQAHVKDLGFRILWVNGRFYACTRGGVYLFSPHARRWVAFAAERPRGSRTNPASAALSVVLTFQCNYQCAYCWQRPLRARPLVEKPRAQLDTLGRLLRSWQNTVTDVRIQFTGGEPLLRWDHLTRLADCAKKLAGALGLRCHFSITTNGSLLSSEIVRWCVARNVRVCISMDGPACIHELARTNGAGAGTHQETLAGLQVWKDIAPPSSSLLLRATIHHSTGSIVEVYRYVAEFEPSTVVLGFCVAGAPERWLITPEDMDRIVEEWPVFSNEYLRRLRAGRRHTLEPLATYGSWVLWPKDRQSFWRCPALAQRGVAILPDGTVLPCENLMVMGGKLLPATPADCSACWARNACGGPCAAEGGPSPLLCGFTRSLVERTVSWVVGLSSEDVRLLADTWAP